MAKIKLDSQERLFFKTVYNAAFANPFSELREKLDLKIAGLFPSAPRKEAINHCLTEVDRKIRELEKRGRADINLYEEQDSDLIKIVFLFDMFHKFRDKFDQLINDQIIAQDTPVKVPFAREAIENLRRKGFDDSSIAHYFALSWQLRRAFYFISTTLVGESPCMQTLKKHLWHNVFTHDMELYDQYLWNKMEDFSTLLLGETGTGKGTAAKAIGRSGYIPFDTEKQMFVESFTKAFSSLNLSQYPETLLESELFGHTKGAFTGAVDDYKGVFARCSAHGSILLDEIGEIPGHVQIKLLRVLQERNFSPVGGHKMSRFKGRVIGATNRPRKDITDHTVFREDFYYRLCSDIIEVPPLRLRISERPEELDDLLKFTVKKITGSSSPKVIGKIKRTIDREPGKDYKWPGNVRELEQCIRSIVLKKGYKGKNSGVSPNLEQMLLEGITCGDIPVSFLVPGYCILLYERLGTYEKVARLTGLDRRTIKKHITNFKLPDS